MDPISLSFVMADFFIYEFLPFRPPVACTRHDAES
jgi:hypothetical protein